MSLEGPAPFASVEASDYVSPAIAIALPSLREGVSLSSLTARNIEAFRRAERTLRSLPSSNIHESAEALSIFESFWHAISELAKSPTHRPDAGYALGVKPSTREFVVPPDGSPYPRQSFREWESGVCPGLRMLITYLPAESAIIAHCFAALHWKIAEEGEDGADKVEQYKIASWWWSEVSRRVSECGLDEELGVVHELNPSFCLAMKSACHARVEEYRMRSAISKMGTDSKFTKLAVHLSSSALEFWLACVSKMRECGGSLLGSDLFKCAKAASGVSAISMMRLIESVELSDARPDRATGVLDRKRADAVYLSVAISLASGVDGGFSTSGHVSKLVSVASRHLEQQCSSLDISIPIATGAKPLSGSEFKILKLGPPDMRLASDPSSTVRKESPVVVDFVHRVGR